MTTRRKLLLAAFSATALSCACPCLGLAIGWPRKHVPTPDPDTTRALEDAADRLCQNDNILNDIPMSDWPDELRRMSPEAVRVWTDGLCIVFGTSFVEQWGLFVQKKESNFQPRGDTDPSFQHLRGRVYRYDSYG